MHWKLSLVAGLAAAASVAVPARAWDDFGHMAVAAVAWEQMTPGARARATELVKLNPYFKARWDKAFEHAGTDRDKFVFMIAATWPDLIKDDPDYQNDGPNRGNTPPPGPEASQNIGYTDHLRHKYWHFVDIPFTTDGSDTSQPPTPNARTQIAALRKTLPGNSGATDDVRAYDLVWLLHIVGDVHQPLHAIARFAKAYPPPAGDVGGNLVPVDCAAGVSCEAANELHAFWDNLLGPDDTTPPKVAPAADELAKADEAKASITDETVWIEESFALAKAKVYVSPIRDDRTMSTITEDYKANALTVAKQRVALAGARLARILNAAFK